MAGDFCALVLPGLVIVFGNGVKLPNQFPRSGAVGAYNAARCVCPEIIADGRAYNNKVVNNCRWRSNLELPVPAQRHTRVKRHLTVVAELCAGFSAKFIQRNYAAVVGPHKNPFAADFLSRSAMVPPVTDSPADVLVSWVLFQTDLRVETPLLFAANRIQGNHFIEWCAENQLIPDDDRGCLECRVLYGPGFVFKVPGIVAPDFFQILDIVNVDLIKIGVLRSARVCTVI